MSDRNALLERCDAGFGGFVGVMAELAGGVWDARDGLLVWAAPVPTAHIVNGAIATARVDDADTTLARVNAFFSERGSGYGLHVRAHGDAELESAARAAGMPCVVELAAMGLEAPITTPSIDGIVLEEVVDAEGLAAHTAVAAEAFGSELADAVHAAFAHPDAVLAAPAGAVLARPAGGGASLASAFVSVRDGIGCVGWVGTREDCRGRGLGTVCTAWAANRAFELGAEFVTLQASPAGLPVYEAMGFEELSHYRVYTGGSS